MNFCPGSKNSIGKTPKIVTASFHETQKITKMSFNIPFKMLV
jgi:hypothetical protein